MGGEAYVGALGRKKLLIADAAEPRSVAGKYLTIPDITGYLARVRHSSGWGKSAVETQCDAGFRFSGKAFRKYMLEHVNVKTSRVYFPAAYFGRVAKELENAGSDVFASDLSDYWVMHLQKNMKLRAEKRGFEEIPDGKYDVAVSFEPICVPPLPKYLAIMRLIARGIPFVKIYSSCHLPYEYGKKELMRLADGRPITAAYRISGKRGFVCPYPEGPASTDRLAYDYGAEYRNADYHYESERDCFFKAVSMVPDKGAEARARDDAAMLERIIRCNAVSGEPVRIAEYSEKTGSPPERVAASLYRLIDIFNRRFMGFIVNDGYAGALLQVNIKE